MARFPLQIAITDMPDGPAAKNHGVPCSLNLTAPACITTIPIDDKDVLSRSANWETLINTLDTLLEDHQGYHSFNDQYRPDTVH